MNAVHINWLLLGFKKKSLGGCSYNCTKKQHLGLYNNDHGVTARLLIPVCSISGSFEAWGAKIS